jgi:hypothetical protein
MTNVVDLSLTVTSSILGKLEKITRRLVSPVRHHLRTFTAYSLDSNNPITAGAGLTRFAVKIDAKSPPAADNLIHFTFIKWFVVIRVDTIR